MATLQHAWYAQTVPEGIHQHKYMGGGHPGCGGYMEALEIESIHGPIFLLHEYWDDYTFGNVRRQRYRWRIFDDGAALFEAWSIAATLSRTNEGFTDWSEKPFWESVNYNDMPE